MIITKATPRGPIWLCGQNPKTNRGISRSGLVLLNSWTYEICSGNCQMLGPAKFSVTLFGTRVALFHEHEDPCASDLCAGSPGCLGCLFTSCHSVLREFHLIILSPHQFSSVQSLSHVRLFVTPWTAAPKPPCPSPTPGVYSDSCPLSQWCHPAISSSVIPFSSHLQSFPALGSFPVS